MRNLKRCVSKWLQVNQQHPLTRYHLQKIISAREEALMDPEPPATLLTLEMFAVATHYRLLRLQVRPFFLARHITLPRRFKLCLKDWTLI